MNKNHPYTNYKQYLLLTKYFVILKLKTLKLKLNTIITMGIQELPSIQFGFEKYLLIFF